MKHCDYEGIPRLDGRFVLQLYITYVVIQLRLWLHFVHVCLSWIAVYAIAPYILTVSWLVLILPPATIIFLFKCECHWALQRHIWGMWKTWNCISHFISSGSGRIFVTLDAFAGGVIRRSNRVVRYGAVSFTVWQSLHVKRAELPQRISVYKRAKRKICGRPYVYWLNYQNFRCTLIRAYIKILITR